MSDADIADAEARWLDAAEIVYAVRDDVDLRRSDPQKWRSDYDRAASVANAVFAEVEKLKRADDDAVNAEANDIASRIMRDKNPLGEF